MIDIILDTLIDNAKLFPFLFLTYLAMEAVEHRTGDKTKKMIQKSGRFGPIIGGVLGVIPQCGFSAAASNLYAGGIITMGTLLAVFLSTSDEMLPILISESVPAATIIKILLMKMAIGILAGILIDVFIHKKNETQEFHIHEMCEHGNCHCEKGIFRSALRHTFQIFTFLLLLSFVLNCLMHYVGADALSGMIFNVPVLGVVLAGLVGLIPNCASSVLITQLYLQKAMSFGAMMAGLLVGAGVGILVLCRVHEDKKDCARIIFFLYIIGVVVGVLLEAAGVQA